MKSKLRKVLAGIVTFAVLGVTAAAPSSESKTPVTVDNKKGKDTPHSVESQSGKGKTGGAGGTGGIAGGDKGTAAQTPPPNKDFYKTVDGCNIQYNPAYRSIQAFIDVTSINQKYYRDTFVAKVYRNGIYDSKASYSDDFIGKNTTNIDVPFGVEDKWIGNIPYPIPATFKIVCYHNDTEFKTITFSVNEHGFA